MIKRISSALLLSTSQLPLNAFYVKQPASKSHLKYAAVVLRLCLAPITIPKPTLIHSRSPNVPEDILRLFTGHYGC
jgi:hypothetical protein